MPFPDNQGGAWYVWGNGFAMKLYTHTIRDDGLVAGEIDDGVRPLVTFDGQFDDTTKKFEFVRTLSDTGEVQTYVGFLFDQLTDFAGSPLNPQGSKQNYWVFAGTFTSVGGFEDPNRQATGYGWFAVTEV